MPSRIAVLVFVLGISLPAWSDEASPVRALFARLPADEKEVTRMLDRMREGGFNTLIVETFYHGQTVCASQVFPQHAEFRDTRALANVIARCKDRDFRVFAWVHTLYWRPVIRGNPIDPAPSTGRSAGLSLSLLDQHPEWLDRTVQGLTTDRFEGQHQFVSASVPEVRNMLRDLCLEIGEHFEVDGIVLDYIRAARDAKGRAHFGYTVSAREKFVKEMGEDPIDIPTPGATTDETDRARWIRWTAWRENEISTLVSDISAAFREGCRRRGARGIVVAAVFPDYYRDRGRSTIVQDWARWGREGWVDWLMPTLYAFDLRVKKNDLDEVRGRTRGTRVQLVPVFAAKKGTAHPEAHVQAAFAKENGLKNFAFFNYGWLAETPESFARVRREL